MRALLQSSVVVERNRGHGGMWLVASRDGLADGGLFLIYTSYEVIAANSTLWPNHCMECYPLILAPQCLLHHTIISILPLSA